ncbi:MAG: V-type ATP synthase subunit D [Acholeplasmatales bacterium]
MQKQINPTRQELTKLKRNLEMTARGHKLLKDKQDEMIRRFMAIINDAKILREEVNGLLSLSVGLYKKALAKSNPYILYDALSIPSNEVKLEFFKENIMSVHVPNIRVLEKDEKEITYSFYSTPAVLDEAILELGDALPKLIKLAVIEKRVDMLASEIEKTRRRVNAIEHIMIPELEVNIKTIEMKLDDQERSNTVRMMKSKEIITERK